MSQITIALIIMAAMIILFIWEPVQMMCATQERILGITDTTA